MRDGTRHPEVAALLMEIVDDPCLRQDLDQILGDFCHQCRNRLNSLKLSLYLAKRQSPRGVTTAWQALETDYQTLEDQLDRLQTLCRPIALSPVTIALCLLFEDRQETWSRLIAHSGATLEFQHPITRGLARYDVNQLGAALDSMVAWRAEQGAPALKTIVRWWVESDHAHVHWHEPHSIESDLGDRSTTTESHWSLPILARIVAEHGGTVRVDDHSGWDLDISWPAHSN